MLSKRLLVLLGLLSLVGARSQAAEPADGLASPRRLLLLGQGPDGHPPAAHEYFAGLRILKKCLDRVEGLQATIVNANRGLEKYHRARKQAAAATV